MSNQPHKDLFAMLKAEGLLEYGCAISGLKIRSFLGLIYPDTAPKKVYDQLALAELAAVDYVRNILLGQGMYLTQSNGDYRILLPSENAKQIELYISSADKKLSRALKLSRNSPLQKDRPNCQTESRIMMKKTGIRTHENLSVMIST